MKKLIAGTAIAALAAASLSAEITFGSWGRALWITAANSYDGDNNIIVTDVHQSWGGNAPRTALGVQGNSDNVGYKLDIHANATELGVGDNALIWVKPIDMVRISVGKHDENFLRGDAAYGLWNWDRIGNVDGHGEGWTFGEYLDIQGVDFQITPNEALSIGVAVPLSLTGSHDTFAVVKDNGETESDPYTTGSLQDAWLNSAIVAAYKIEGTGTVKAGLKLHSGATKGTDTEATTGRLSWTDANDDGNITLDELSWVAGTDAVDGVGAYAKNKKGKDVKTWADIAAAFDYTGSENLFASVGVVIPTKNNEAKKVNGYVKYTADALTVHGIAGLKLNVDDANDDDTDYDHIGFTVGAGVDYALENNVGIFADVRYADGVYAAGNSKDRDVITFGFGATKGFSNGVIGAAFEGSTRGTGRYEYKNGDNPKKAPLAWEIPVKFEYWF